MGGTASKPAATNSDASLADHPIAATTSAPSDNESVTIEESKCPMHRSDGSYSYDWTTMFGAAKAHGTGGSKPLTKEQQEQAKKPKAEQISSSQEGGGCPVRHHPATNGSKTSSFPEYNVYSQPIDKTNQMPQGIKTQMPFATQKTELSTDRVKSTIPKGGGDNVNDSSKATSTWTYPSPQQFFNALARKGKLDDDTSEEDMESVVALHNNMNEKTWAQVVEWERQTYKDGAAPKLLRFQGRPHDLSPKARLKSWLGHPLPFDRHDWTVLRDNGTTVRYVIDYYYDESRAQTSVESAKPHLHDRNATPSLLVDVRPALDGPGQFVARAFQMPFKLTTGQTIFEPLPLRGTRDMESQVQESVAVWQSIQQLRKQSPTQELKEEFPLLDKLKVSNEDAKAIALQFSDVLKKCRKQQAAVNKCSSEEECSKASMDLTMCMGPILCPVQHICLVNELGGDDDTKIEAALETLTECVVFANAQRQVAKQQHPSHFQ